MENQSTNNTIPFIKELAKYYMDFLETDFHKRRNPKRSIKLRNEDNLLVGINLSKYPSFFDLSWKLIQRSFDKNVIKPVTKGVYKTNIPSNLMDLIKLQAEKLKDFNLSEITEEIAGIVQNGATLYKDDFDKALVFSLEGSSEVILHKIALPFITLTSLA